jgi:hypothetical protein
VDTDFRFFMRAERMRKRSDGSYELVLVLKPHTPEPPASSAEPTAPPVKKPDGRRGGPDHAA